MSRRWPVVPTILVALAVVVMIGLGLWQLTVRRPQKLAQLGELATNPAKPPIAMPQPPTGDALLFRRATAMCVRVTGRTVAGAGAAGFRVIARCAIGPQGPGFSVQLGTSRDPKIASRWAGGPVSGYLSHLPDQRPAIAGLFGDEGARELILITDRPPPGLTANAGPNLDAVPNNHLAYAVQWFLFALIAATIYAIAVLRRRRPG